MRESAASIYAPENATAARFTLERLTHLLAAGPAVIYSAGIYPNSATTFISENVVDQLGYEPREFLLDPRFWGKNLHPDDLQAFYEGLTRVGREGRQTLEYRFRHRDGGYRWIIDEVRLVTNGGGRPREMIGCMIDITERRRGQEGSRRQDRAESLREKREALGRLAGGVAHDFNNLLTTILGYGRLLRSGLEPDHPLQREIDEILHAGERATRLTRQLTLLQRGDIAEPGVVDLNRVVTDLTGMVEDTVGATIRLEVALAPGSCNVSATQGELEQMLLDLSVNARRAMPHGGQLKIETARVDLPDEDPRGAASEFVAFKVTDTGAGIAEEERRHVFEPYVATGPGDHGRGLGLAIVDAIAQRHGGFAEVDSRPGLGSSFRVFLPRFENRRPSPTPIEQTGRMRRLGGPETILLVEDEISVRRLVRRNLESLGYHVIEAQDGLDALAKFDGNGHIDLVLSDVVMPGMAGPELAETLRKRRPDLRFLFATGYPDERLLDPGLCRPDTRVIQKPFEMATLAREVRAALSGRD